MIFDPVSLLYKISIKWGFSDFLAVFISRAATIVFIVLIALIFWLIASKIIYGIIRRISEKTKADWDNILVKRKFFSRISWLVPALIIRVFVNNFLLDSIVLKAFLVKSADLLIILSVTLALVDFLGFINSLYSRRPNSKRRPIKGIIQAVQVVLIAASILIAFSVITERPVTGLLAGLGALSAVTMLIFQEPLTGLVAGFQISSNDMVRIGDWISVPAHNADGDVIDINLLTVTVQNWDKTIASVPIKALTTESFKNWRGMSESGGRRIKRSLLIDVTSIHFLSDEEKTSLKKIALIKDYIEEREKEITEYNINTKSDRNASPVNGRSMTNIGVFRIYAQKYLSANPKINKNLTLMVRQLQSGSQGLPIEVYAFSADKAWVNYEAIQADIFDHLLAVLSEFNLKAFQFSTGSNFEKKIIDSTAKRLI